MQIPVPVALVFIVVFGAGWLASALVARDSINTYATQTAVAERNAIEAKQNEEEAERLQRRWNEFKTVMLDHVERVKALRDDDLKERPAEQVLHLRLLGQLIDESRGDINVEDVGNDFDRVRDDVMLRVISLAYPDEPVESALARLRRLDRSMDDSGG